MRKSLFAAARGARARELPPRCVRASGPRATRIVSASLCCNLDREGRVCSRWCA